MAAIILPRKHYAQPEGRVEVCWGNPLTDYLRVAVLGSAPYLNLVTAWAGAASGSFFDNLSGRAGQAFGSNPSTSGVVTHNSSLTNIDENPISIFALYDRNGQDTRNKVILQAYNQADGTGKNSFFMGEGGAYGSTNIWYRGDAGVASSLSGAGGGPRDAPTPMGCVITSSTLRSYNDKNVTATLANTSSSVFRNTRIVLGGSENSASRWPGRIYVVLVWQGFELTPDAFLDFSNNPWQLFKADPTRIYSLPPVLTIPSLSNPGVIDITANSARPQVTLAY